MNDLSAAKEADCRRSDWFRRIWSVFALVLFAVTWRLWTPQTTYPQIPALGLCVEWPAWIDWLGLAGVGIGLLVSAITTRPLAYKAALLLFIIAALVLMMLDQHRLQPWAYQFVVLAFVMACCRPLRALRLMRALAVSVYVYSAISKFDYQFLHTLGREFLSTLVGYLGLPAENWTEPVQLLLVGFMPLGELLVGLGLLIPRTRRVAVGCAVVLHISLLLILGPWGLGHKSAVLIWNLFFIVQAGLLFWNSSATTPAANLAEATQDNDIKRPGSSANQPPARIMEIGATFVVWFVILFPITEAFGVCDHWPAWELYSPRNSRAQIYIHAAATKDLPAPLQQHLAAVQGNDPWQRMHIDEWSLDELDAPIYPQDRFQLGVALAIAQRYQLDRSIRVVRQSAANRWSGERSEQELAGTEQLKIACGRFRLNTLERSLAATKQ